jgi:hypothetical protein
MIEETVPLHLLGLFGPITNLASNFGKMITIVLGVGLPDRKDKEGLAHTNFWKVIFGFPLVLIAI